MSQQINLFNPIYRQQKKYLSAVTMAQAFGLILFGALLLGGYASYRSLQLKQQAADGMLQLQAAQARLATVTVEFAPRQKNPELTRDVKQIDAEVASLQKIASILQAGELGNTKGYASYFRAFARQIIDGVWLTGFSIHGAGSEIALLGRTLRPELVPAYIHRLKTEKILQGTSFSTLEMQVPVAESPKNNAPINQRITAANYIEFSLQSTGLAKQPAGPAGTSAR